MKIKIIKEVYSDKQRRFMCAVSKRGAKRPKGLSMKDAKKKCKGPMKETAVLDREELTSDTFKLDNNEPVKDLKNASRDERAKTWNYWRSTIEAVVRPYFVKNIMQDNLLEKFVERMTNDEYILLRVKGASDDGYITPKDLDIIMKLSNVSHPEHRMVKDMLLDGNRSVVKSAMSYLTVLGIEFATILKKRAYRVAGENPTDIMMDALEARFDNYILYGRGPGEQRDEFIKKSKEYNWDKEHNIPSMYDIRESKRKIKVKII